MESVNPGLLKKTSFFLNKPKLLYIGDSIAHNIDFFFLERETKTRIKTTRAYSSIYDKNAKFPHKNFNDVTDTALANTHKDDMFTYLALSAPSVDITNMDTAKLNPSDNIEVYKQQIYISCKNMFTVASKAIKRHPQLVKVLVFEHAPRYDLADVDPTRLKPYLARFANLTLFNLWHSCAFQDRIQICRHNLDCTEENAAAWYKSKGSGKYDGVHMYGPEGLKAYSRSVSEIIKSALLVIPTQTTPCFSNQNTSCLQGQFQDSYHQSKARSIFKIPDGVMGKVIIVTYHILVIKIPIFRLSMEIWTMLLAQKN